MASTETRAPHPKILNNQLVPVQTGKVQVGPDGREVTSPDENEHILHPSDGYEAHLDNIQKAQENKKRNTYALKVGEANERSSKGGNVNTMLGHHSTASNVAKNRQAMQPGGSKSGMFLPSKQLVFGENKKLVPQSNYYHPPNSALQPGYGGGLIGGNSTTQQQNGQTAE